MKFIPVLKKFLPWAGAFYLIALIFLLWGIGIGRYQVFPYKQISSIYKETRTFLQGGGFKPYHLQEKKNKFSFTGFQLRDKDFSDDGYLLMSRFDYHYNQVIIELVRLKDFLIIHRWVPPLETILQRSGKNYRNSEAKNEYRAQHPLLLKNGAIVFHSGEGPLVKIDKDSNLVWLIDQHFHHSISLTHDGKLLVPIVNRPNILKLEAPFRDDGYAVITQDGEILEQFSAGQILMDNGYRGRLLGVGIFEQDRIHLNDAHPIDVDTKNTKQGDVALSLRNLSTVMLFRPSTGKIIWLKTGPWLNQHDINLLNNENYSIFGNDVYRVLYQQKNGKASEISEIYVYNPTNQSVETPYTNILKEVGMHSETGGRAKILENGDVYIEESDENRLMRISKDLIRWEYVNGTINDRTGAVHWCRYMTAEQLKNVWEDKL